MNDQPDVKTFTDGPFVQELRTLVKQQLVPSYEWYRNHTKGPMLCFRLAGFFVAVGSISLPVISSVKDADFPSKTYLLTTVSLVVAVLSSLSLSIVGIPLGRAAAEPKSN